jgi:hypothetical protein
VSLVLYGSFEAQETNRNKRERKNINKIFSASKNNKRGMVIIRK